MVDKVFCVGCGYVIDEGTVGCKIEGVVTTVDGDVAVCELFYCRECWCKVLDIIEGGMEKAIMNSEALRRQDLDDQDSMGQSA